MRAWDLGPLARVVAEVDAGAMTTGTHEPTVVAETSGAPAGQDDRFVAWFTDVTREDVERVGGKGANLGELTQAEFPVPPGFVVTADAYLHALDEGGVRATLRGRVAGLDIDDPAALEAGRPRAAVARPRRGSARGRAPSGARRVP